jgi:hypothetical protein
MAKKGFVIHRTVILEYDRNDLDAEERINDFVHDGIHHIEWEGDLQDPYIRSKKVVCYLRSFMFSDGFLYASVIPRAGEKTLPEGWPLTHDFKVMKSPSGGITKIVLVKKEDEA